MRKLYIVRLTKQERVELQSVVKKLKGTGQKVRRAQMWLKADAGGPNWIDERIAEATRVGREPLKDFANDSSSTDSMKHSTALSVNNLPERSC